MNEQEKQLAEADRLIAAASKWEPRLVILALVLVVACLLVGVFWHPSWVEIPAGLR
jgi:hypothetical protein